MLPLTIGVPLAIISLVGLFLNGYIFLVLVLVKQASPNNILLIHLSATQTLLSLIFLIFSFPPIVHQGSWIASIEFLCIIQGFLLTILHPLSLWTICGLNCDRFYAIAAPLHYSAIVTNKKVIAGLISGWIVIISLSIPPFFKVAPFKFSTNFGACIPNFATINTLWYAIVFTIITLLVPGIVIVGCNIKVLMIARYHRHRIAAAIYEVTLSAQVTITHQRNPFFVPTVTAPTAGGPKFRSRSPISTVLQLVGSFVILYLPYYILIIWNSVAVTIHDNVNVLDKYKANPYVIIISAVLLTSSTTVNSILYGLKSKIIRKTFQNYWRKKRTKNEINQEIQARTPSTCGSRRPSVTNLGFLTRPLLQRRLSETLIDREQNGTQRPKMKRIASELTWRPASLSFSGLDSPNISRPAEPIVHTTSCNTLQVPCSDNDTISDADKELYQSVRNSFRTGRQIHQINPRKSAQITATTGTTTISNTPRYTALTNTLNYNNNHHYHSSKATTFSTANFLLHKMLRLDHNEHLRRLPNINNNKRNILNSPLKSPRILITRAFSDESEKTPSLPGTPAKERLHRQYSSSSNLADRNNKWIQQHTSSSSYKNIEIFKKATQYQYHQEQLKLQQQQQHQQFKQQQQQQQIDPDDSCDTTSRKADLTNDSNSTTYSEISQRRYSSLEETSVYSREFDIDPVTEEQLLLSWPTTRKKFCSNINRNKLYGGSSKNGIFRPSPLFNDRSEEPEVIL